MAEDAWSDGTNPTLAEHRLIAALAEGRDLPAVKPAAKVHLIELGIITWTWTGRAGYALTHRGSMVASRIAESEAAHA